MASGLSRRRFRCTGCGNCCRELVVPLTHADVARLARASGRPPAEFVELLPPEAVDMSGEPASFVELDVGRRLLALARRDGACCFLSTDHCTAWSARPASCRTYPLSATLGARSGIRRLTLVPRGVDCRYELDAEMPLAEIRDAELAEQRELAQYQALVARFNRAQKHRTRLGRRAADARELFAFLERHTG